MKEHNYQVSVEWTGNKGKGTLDSKSYTRNHKILSDGKYDSINGSSDPAFMGDKTKYNPEDLLVSSISACHMLCYLHLCAVNNIVVTRYTDNAIGVMEETENGSGRFTQVTLNPSVIVTNSDMIQKANELHHQANKMCFIANSCNFRIEHIPTTISELS
ncbi:MAG: peroxiredoxin [marine bacterium B5-7]|nr:MAG: peroxiredoxin [marine bacterium B5-7]